MQGKRSMGQGRVGIWSEENRQISKERGSVMSQQEGWQLGGEDVNGSVGNGPYGLGFSGVNSRDGRFEDARGVPLGAVDIEHFNGTKEVVVRRAKGAGKAVEGASYFGDRIAAAHE